jgi:lysophospholipase L1-like esterase
MLNASGQPDRKYYGEDSLHMSPQGYQLWTKIIGGAIINPE